MSRKRKLRDGIASVVNQLDPSIAKDMESGADPLATLRLVELTAALNTEAEESLRGTVDSARAAGLSWEQIGDTLRVSRQAAQQRFGTRVAPDNTPQFWRLHPVTAFNEIQRLNEVGRFGWRSVGFGALFHDLVRTEMQWEHRRVSVFSTKKPSKGDGWQLVEGMWFPWMYYAHPTGAHALSGDAPE